MSNDSILTAPTPTGYKQKKNISIREVNNGFMIEGGWDNSFIASNLEEVVKAVTEILSK